MTLAQTVPICSEVRYIPFDYAQRCLEGQGTFYRCVCCHQLHVKAVLVQAGGRGDPRTPNTPADGGVVCMIPITPDTEVDALMK